MRTAVGRDELVTIIEDQLITATEEDAARIGEDGFVSAILDTRSFPLEDGLEPCPETCAFDNAEFDVDGIPNAQGIQGIATQERLDQVGDDRPPFAEYLILFADGPFAYRVKLFGPRMTSLSSRPRKWRRNSMSASTARLHPRSDEVKLRATAEPECSDQHLTSPYGDRNLSRLSTAPRHHKGAHREGPALN